MSSDSSNRLAEETSPYLLQHAHNPVDWYPWGEEALERAHRESRPILLSVGYAACHWCHVMERESFEDATTAELMNEHFVCIKVDREERPDVDDVYMRAVQMMTGSGGWPLTVFLTPELEPFYGGTYFPPEPRMGMPSFRGVLQGVVDAWNDRRDEVTDVGRQLTERLQPRPGGDGEPVGLREIHRGVMELHERFDPNFGGFGGAPKFPNSTSIALLLRYGARQGDSDAIDQASFSLRQMSEGGIHDQLGGGFHRYTVDKRWLVPHFEKMLYDNALLGAVFLDAYRITGEEHHARSARSIVRWLTREMITEEGGFAATLDADSEGVEGKFYVWSREQVEAVLGERADLFCRAFDVTEGGNWEGKNILHLPRPLERLAREVDLEETELRERLDKDRGTLLEARVDRIRPGLDDKILADWNGLMISTLARGHRTLGEDGWLAIAEQAARFVLGPMRGDGPLRHSWRQGQRGPEGFLDDYAAMVQAALDLFLSTFAPEWLEAATRLADEMLERFAGDNGALYFTAPGHDRLAARPRSGHDGATPSGNGMAAGALATLARLTGEERFDSAARAIPGAFAAQIRRHASGFATLLLAVDSMGARPRELVVAAAEPNPTVEAALDRLWARYAPAELVLARTGDEIEALDRLCPVVRDKEPTPGSDGPTFYDCSGRTCQPPTDDLGALLES